jgi:hypothetical protein
MTKSSLKALPFREILLIASSAILLLSIGNYIYHYVLFTEQTWNLVSF